MFIPTTGKNEATDFSGATPARGNQSLLEILVPVT
jgi:hypothetical protein